MKTIARVHAGGTREASASRPSSSQRWDELASIAASWCRVEGVSWRDAVVIVPFLELLAPARRAFARIGVWMPRVETTRTLAVSLGPPSGADAEGGFDVALDALMAMQLISRESWGAEWLRRDRRGFEHAARRVVTTVREIGRAAGAIPPAGRASWWVSARETLRASGGMAGKERLLAQVALEWAAAAAPPATDRLFELRPSAWIAIEAGGPEALCSALLAASERPALVIATDVPLDAPFRALASVPGDLPAFALCDGFEDEASAAAAQVLDHLGRGERPVALVAQDRVLVRRIRALLERASVAIADETGWKLSTTRAGATVMALLQAARPAATTDTYLDWLKSVPVSSRSVALASLESACRKSGAVQRESIAALTLETGAARLHADATATLHELEAHGRRRLPDWLDALRSALDRCGALIELRDDAAGRQALAALALDPRLSPERQTALATDVDAITLAEFTHWVDDILERVAYRPPNSEGNSEDSDDRDRDEDAPADRRGADVVVTPLARVMLRPFAAVVLPGADDRSLGPARGDDSLLPRAVAEALALPGPGARRDSELLAFAQALRLPRVTLLRRRGDANDPVADSPLVERLSLALAEQGRALSPWRDPRIERRLRADPVHRGAPVVAADALPTRLSASAFEALRACPYRFFARAVLGLGEADELDGEVEKRDYGSWLHAVLHTFHRERESGREGNAGARRDVAAGTLRLLAIGAIERDLAGIDAASFLPFESSFAAFVPRYIAWLHEREEQGWRWESGETDMAFAAPGLEGVELFGRIDRIDRREGPGPAMLELIDYKTGSASKLKEQLREPFEDTQLAFYAALVGSHSDAPLSASYLALDGTRGLEKVGHPDIGAGARALVAGAADEMRRLRAGAGLPALGAGSACEYCLARGLCRRDHWSAEPASSADDVHPADVGGDARSH